MKWLVGVSMIAVVMGWAAMATIPAAAISIDGASLKFLPSDTQAIASIDVAALLNAPLVQETLKNAPLKYPRELDEFIAATGFDPQRDLDKVTVGKVGARDGLVIVQGRIDKFKVEQFLKDKGKETETYLGQALFHDGDGAVAALDGVVLLGKLDTVKKAVDQMQLPGSTPLRSELTAAVQTIEAGNQVWAVGDFSVADLGGIGVPALTPAFAMLKSLQSGTYQMRVDTDIHARGTGTFSDAESARNLGDLAKGALALAKLQVAKQQPDVLHVLDGIQISTSGTTLVVRIEESGDLLKKLQNLRTVAALRR